MNEKAWISIDPVPGSMTAEGIRALNNDHLAKAKEIVAGIRALKDAPDEALTWEATFGAMDDAGLALELSATFPSLMHMTHPDAAVREAAAEAEPKVSEFVTNLLMDADLATVFKRYAAKNTDADPGRQKLVQETLRDYRRNGLELPPEKQAQLRKLNEELTELGQKFESNIAAANAFIEIEPAQLKGLSESFIADHPAGENGKVKITTAYPDYKPFMKYAEDREAAKQLHVVYNTRAQKENLPILDRVLALRKEKAVLLGYKTWADYVLETRMAKDPKTVFDFLGRLHTALKTKSKEEFTRFGKEVIPVSDATYYEEMVNRRDYAFDSAALSEYFEFSSVEKGLLETMSELFGIEFREVEVPAWHEEVRCLDVLDDEKPLGRIYLDLHPRDNKYSHAAVFGIRNSRRLSDGSRLPPMCSLVCNFPRKGGLLSHEDVTTLFHEFGHAIHKIMYQGELSSLAGLNVSRDFVEAPSQLLEEWAWDRSCLDRFAKHHKTGEKIPDELFQAMAKSRHFGDAIFTERQLMLAMLDMTYHTKEPGFDTTTVMRELSEEYSPFQFIEGTTMQACFGHLMGYDAGYYGYQWALSIAQDLLTRFHAEGLMNRQTATEYRERILAMGATREESEMVEAFLGRPSNEHAYLKFLGVNV
ncbi:Zn-dependent oligopeptidase [Patescibacteria group bacterium]|jgi:thimet oligopeptidase|nr:Zn-dependent oligopeptidase [Patescibacteria group bacterium]